MSNSLIKDNIINTETIPNFEYGVIWQDPVCGHRIACLDVSKKDVNKLKMQGGEATLAIQDPPYNVLINKVNGKITENFERSKSLTIRADNVWYDIQQVFYLLHENIEGCFAQKPLKSAKRIIEASSKQGDLVVDFFGHSGSTLLQAKISQRKCYTMDINPTYCKIMAARLLHYRRTGETGWSRTKILKDRKILISDKVLLGLNHKKDE